MYVASRYGRGKAKEEEKPKADPVVDDPTGKEEARGGRLQLGGEGLLWRLSWL